MRIVCRHDGDKINTVITRGLLVCHFVKIRIHAAGVRQVIRLSGRAVLIHAAGEAAADQLDLVVHQGCRPVYGSDECAVAAADHAHSQFSVHLLKY